MRLPEYRSKALFRQYGIRVPVGVTITKEDYHSGLINYDSVVMPSVVKAQNMIGGRGKASGIRICETSEDVKKHIIDLFENGFSGNIVDELLIEEKIAICKEAYLSIAIDRGAGNFCIMASGKGGVEIESMSPSGMRMTGISNLIGLQGFQIMYTAKPFVEAGADLQEMKTIIQNLYSLLKKENALLAEINPLVIRSDGSLLAADAKIILDDNAVKRDEVVCTKNNLSPLEAAGKELGVNMVKLDGNIAVISNGAGEGMTSLDQIAQAGGSLSLWIDLGGGALSAKPEALDNFIEKVMDTRPEVLLFTAFFQIGKCDVFANSFRNICQKRKERNDYLPQIILRLDGRNADKAKEISKGTEMLIMDSSGEACVMAANLAKAGKKNVNTH